MNIKILTKAFVFSFIFSVLSLISPPAFAHPGNVSSDGCHYCWSNCSSWGFTYGTRHNRANPYESCTTCRGPVDPLYCHPAVIAPPTATSIRATFNHIPNNDGATYTVNMRWTGVQSTAYSLSIDKNIYGDPGPISDTTNNYYSFYNVLPGQYFVHIKYADNNNYWTSPIYWNITVPPWIPPPAAPELIPQVPTPTPIRHCIFFICWS